MQTLKVTGTPDSFIFTFLYDGEGLASKSVELKRDEVRVLDGMIKLLYTVGVLNESPVLTSIELEMDIDKVMKQANEMTAQLKQQQGIPAEGIEKSEGGGPYV